MHGHPGQGKGDKSRNSHQLEKIFRQHTDDIARAGSQHLPDADLPDTLLRGVSCQSQQTNAGNKDSQDGEYSEDTLYGLLRFVLIGQGLIQESIMKWFFRDKVVPGLLDGPDRIGKIISPY